MFLHSLLPVAAQIVARGGAGKESWGHPLEPTAQYNHLNPERLKPPICPWRIEVADPANNTRRTLFLHVFEVAKENDREPVPVKVVEPAGVDIGNRWRVRFNPAGALGGEVGGQPLAANVQIEAQYRK
jgi:hypothetical protein